MNDSATSPHKLRTSLDGMPEPILESMRQNSRSRDSKDAKLRQAMSHKGYFKTVLKASKGEYPELSNRKSLPEEQKQSQRGYSPFSSLDFDYSNEQMTPSTPTKNTRKQKVPKKQENQKTRIKKFRDEFISHLDDPNPKILLDRKQVSRLLTLMGFVQKGKNPGLSQEIEDIFTLTKQQNKIMSENLLNILIIISGERNTAIEIENRLQNKNWTHAGVYNELGQFLVRNGEHICIQKHFRILRTNWNNRQQGLNDTNNSISPSRKTRASISRKSDVFQRLCSRSSSRRSKSTEQRHSEECTFNPQITKYINISKDIPVKLTETPVKPKKGKLPISVYKQKARLNNDLTTVYSQNQGAFYGQNQGVKNNFVDLTTLSDEEEPDPENTHYLSDARQPILLVEINLTDIREETGACKMETILVFEGDSPEHLAKNFAKQHNLRSKIQCKLEDMLRVQISKILPAINENESECD